jgi:hypothetical protein
MNPIAGEKPVGQRGYDPGRNRNQGESRPVHALSFPRLRALYSDLGAWEVGQGLPEW